MKIKNTEGLSREQLKDLVKQGGEFVMFRYVVSVVIMTFRKNSDVYFIRPGEGMSKYHWKYSLLTAALGWWGLPWGPIYSIGALYNNIAGSTDVTTEIANHLGLNDHEGYNIPGTNPAGEQQLPGGNAGAQDGSNNDPARGGYNIPM